MATTSASTASRAPAAGPDAASASAKLRRIVVGTDFSESANNALRAAADLAAAHGAEVLIVSAVDPMIATLEVVPEAIIDDVRKGLEQAAAPLQRRGIKAETRMQVGKGWWVVGECANEIDADLVIVASHGRGRAAGLVRLALGSTADRVVRTCRKPVLVIPADWKGSPTQWKTAVVGVDFSHESALASTMAARLLSSAAGAKASLILVHTVALMIEFRGPEAPLAMTQPLPEHWDKAEAEAASHLEEWAAALRSDRLDVTCATFRGYAPDAILQHAGTRHADFIALGTHGRGGLNRFLLGSVAERILHHAQRPVLTVRRPE